MTKLSCDNSNQMPSDVDIKKAVELLSQGHVVGMPTETVYGLAARIDHATAISKIFTTKERPFFDPLIVHVHSVAQAKSLTSFWHPGLDSISQNFWPGPLTLVLPKTEAVNSMITSGLESVGIRMPRHPLALRLIELCGVPLAAPSANKFGKTSPTTAQHVRDEFKNENIFVIDGGPCDVGIESTVLLVKKSTDNFLQLSILRKGAILQSHIEEVLSKSCIDFEFIESVSKKESPGHMKHHYMPAIPLVVIENKNLNSEQALALVQEKIHELPEQIEEVKIIKPANGLHHFVTLQLSDEATVASREFYALLRSLAGPPADCIFFYKEALHSQPEWAGLMDRLYKAASLILS